MKLKYNIPWFCIAASSLALNAQVAINTKNAIGVFHVDAQGNNATTGTPTNAQITDDVVIDAHATAGVNMSVGGKVATNSSAQLALLDANKAMLLNRVALTDLRDIVTVPNPQAGMLVYNTSTSGSFPDNIVPGFYYFNGTIWYKWQYGAMNSAVNQRDLLSNCLSSDVPGLNNAASPMLATLADFGMIKIPETGTYIFALRLYGGHTPDDKGVIPPLLGFTRTDIYVYLMKNGSTKVVGIPINVPNPTTGTTTAYTYTTLIQAVLAKDDIVTLRLGNKQGYFGWEWRAKVGMFANKTSLIYWKI